MSGGCHGDVITPTNSLPACHFPQGAEVTAEYSRV